ncbi:hypothetical protein BHE74_00003096 [Ensete ventricosum]|nr:hypothetical protein BHE74_00003096 [Ensete ventricosum]
MKSKRLYVPAQGYRRLRRPCKGPTLEQVQQLEEPVHARTSLPEIKVGRGPKIVLLSMATGEGHGSSVHVIARVMVHDRVSQ